MNINNFQSFNQAIAKDIEMLDRLQGKSDSKAERKVDSNALTLALNEQIKFISQNMQFFSKDNFLVVNYFNKLKEVTDNTSIPEEIRVPLEKKVATLFSQISDTLVGAEELAVREQLGRFIEIVSREGNDSLVFALQSINFKQGGANIAKQLNAIIQTENNLSSLALGDDAFLRAILPLLDLQAVDSKGKTILHHLAEQSNPTFTAHILSAFKKHGANFNALDAKGFTPLHYAAGHASPQFLKELLSHGADLKIRTRLGQTPFNFAATSENPHNIGILQEAARREVSQHLRKIPTQTSEPKPKTNALPVMVATTTPTLGTAYGALGTGGAIATKASNYIPKVIVSDTSGIEELGKTISNMVESTPLNAVGTVTNAISLVANINKTSVPNTNYGPELALLNQRLLTINTELFQLGEIEETRKKVLLEDKQVIQSRIKALQNYQVTEDRTIKAQCLQNAINIGKNGTNALMNQEYISSVKTLSFVKYGASVASHLTSAVAVYQNWNSIKDLRLRKEQLEQSKQAILTAYDELKKLGSFFPESSVENTLLQLKAKDYEKKLAYLESCSQENWYKQSMVVASTLAYTAALTTCLASLYSGEEMNKMSSNFATGGMVMGFAPLAVGGAYAVSNKLSQVSNATKNWLSSTIDRFTLSVEARQEKNLLRQVAGQLGIKGDELESQVASIEASLDQSEETKVNVINMLTQAGLDTQSFDRNRRTLILQLLAQ